MPKKLTKTEKERRARLERMRKRLRAKAREFKKAQRKKK